MATRYQIRLIAVDGVNLRACDRIELEQQLRYMGAEAIIPADENGGFRIRQDGSYEIWLLNGFEIIDSIRYLIEESSLFSFVSGRFQNVPKVNGKFVQ